MTTKQTKQTKWALRLARHINSFGTHAIALDAELCLRDALRKVLVNTLPLNLKALDSISCWFPPVIHPVHVGVYRIHAPGLAGPYLYWAYWNGKSWHEPTLSLPYAEKAPHSPFMYQWRGLREKP
jgi:hypothetical protein